MCREKLKEIDCAPGYFVSENGEVFRGKRTLSKVDSGGYYRVWIKCKNGQFKGKFVHRLVAETFIRPPKNGEEVNHIDGNKKNNNVDNLEWCCRKYNVWHRDNVLLNSGTKRNTKKIKCVETGIIYDSALKAEKQTHIWRANIIRAAKNGKRAGGYKWRFV